MWTPERTVNRCDTKAMNILMFLFVVNLRKSGSSHDVRGEDLQPQSPLFSRCSSQESLDDNSLIRSTGMRMLHRKISSPLPTRRLIRRRALSETPAEALISPVVPRRCFSPKQLRIGVSRVKSCPIISADSNERLNNSSPSPPLSPRFTFKEVSSGGAQLHNRTLTKFYTAPVSACPTLKTANQERLPRINQTRCSPMLVSAHETPTESARELFNVSPVMGDSADSTSRLNDNNSQCDVNDKVQYFLHTISAEEDIDQ